MPAKKNTKPKKMTEAEFLALCEQKGLNADDALDDLVYDVVCEGASDINNQGVHGQLEYLWSEGYSEKDLKEHFK